MFLFFAPPAKGLLPLSCELGVLSFCLCFLPRRDSLAGKVLHLCRKAYAQAPRLTRWRQSCRWLAAVGLHAWSAGEWFQRLESMEMLPYLRANPRLAFKPFRVYQSTRWNRARRTQVLLDTYAWLGGPGLPLRRSMLFQAPLRLALLELRGLGQAELEVGRDDRFRKEGELVLSLRLAGQEDFIMAAAISVESFGPGRWAMRIGCLQGGHGATQGVIREATKAMHGLRPRAFLLLAAQEVARQTSITRILGAGNAILAHRRKRAVYIPRFHRLDCDYDVLWKEAEGRKEADGWFRLPLETHRKSRQEMPPQKRSAYARRFALMDDVASQIRERFHG